MIKKLLFFLIFLFLANPSFSQVMSPSFSMSVSDDDTTIFMPTNIGFPGASIVTQDGSGVLVTIASGSGDITDVGDCTSGACSSPTISALDFGTVDLATDALDLSEGNITNVGQIDLDTIVSDGNDITLTPTNNVLISDGKRFIVGHTTNIQISNNSPFQILGTTGAKASMGMGRWSNSASGVASYNVLKSRATVIGNHAIVQDNDNVGQFKFLADDNVDFDTQIAMFSAEIDDANPASGIIGGALVFATGDGTNATPIERMRIATDGTATFVGTIIADGLTLGINENITLNSQTLDHDGVAFIFSARISPDAVTLATIGNIKRVRSPLRFTLIDPNAAFDVDTQFMVWPNLDAAITITKISVTLDATGNEIAGDLKYADDFTALTNATVINDFDTTSGVRTDTSITSGVVDAGKFIYIQFDSDPNAAITQASFSVEFSYNG